MNKDVVIKLDNVSKKFKKGHKLLLKEAFLDIFRQAKQDDFWAVNNVSFEIKKGESVGIIGANGSGKSTLLKLIAGVLSPTKGKVLVNGKISPLIELGAGFHPELTGRENIYLNGTILGLTKKEIDEKFDEIVDFSELSDFIDTPVKHYSSGMYMRLGFSIAVHVEPDILLVDEILSVGDMVFQTKCLNKIHKFRDKGVTLILVSHNIEVVKNICNRAFLISGGKLTLEGNPNKVALEYLGSSLEKLDRKAKNIVTYGKINGNNKAKIMNVWIEDDKGIRKNLFGEGVIKINLRVKFLTSLENPIFGIIVRSSFGGSVFESNTNWLGLQTGEFKKGEEKVISWEFKNYLDTGEYSISPAVSYSDGLNVYDWKEDYFWFSVKKSYTTGGVLNFKHSIKVS